MVLSCLFTAIFINLMVTSFQHRVIRQVILFHEWIMRSLILARMVDFARKEKIN